jgi:hypothetical protein
MNAKEKQIGGEHYKTLAIQPMEYSVKNMLDPLQHTVIKYVTRHKAKGGRQDIEKAIHCLEMILEMQYNEDPVPKHETIVEGLDEETKYAIKALEIIIDNLKDKLHELELVEHTYRAKGETVHFELVQKDTISIRNKISKLIDIMFYLKKNKIPSRHEKS